MSKFLDQYISGLGFSLSFGVYLILGPILGSYTITSAVNGWYAFHNHEQTFHWIKGALFGIIPILSELAVVPAALFWFLNLF